MTKTYYNQLQAFLGIMEKVPRPLKLHDTKAEDIDGYGPYSGQMRDKICPWLA